MSQEAALSSPSSPLLLAAQALPYADEPVEGEDELEEKDKEKEEKAERRQRECEQEQPRKQSLGQRRNVELPELYVVNELPEELSSELDTMRERDRDRDIKHFGPGLRRNSISLPQGINSLDLEALRLRHQMLAQESLNEESQAESVSSQQLSEKEGQWEWDR